MKAQEIVIGYAYVVGDILHAGLDEREVEGLRRSAGVLRKVIEQVRADDGGG